MNKNQITCPACGSNQIASSENESFANLTLGHEFSFKEINNKCTSCGEEGDFSAETDKNYYAAQKKAQSNLMSKFLSNINDSGITMAMLERAFELPSRTLTRWKNGDFSSSSLALLRIIITYPWIIEVAENKFEKKYSRCAVITAAAHEINNETKTSSYQKPQLPRASTNSSGANIIFLAFNNTARLTASGG